MLFPDAMNENAPFVTATSAPRCMPGVPVVRYISNDGTAGRFVSIPEYVTLLLPALRPTIVVRPDTGWWNARRLTLLVDPLAATRTLPGGTYLKSCANS